MKRIFKYIFAASVLLIGLVSCNKSELEKVSDSTKEELFEVTIGAKISEETKTSMADNGDINWTEGDKISVTIGSNPARIFTALTGGTTSTEFVGKVSASERKALLDGTQITATYPASGAVVPGTQTFVDGNFADNMFPMTGTGLNSSITFTNPAAVVMAQNIEIGQATSATLQYTVNQTAKEITLTNISSQSSTINLLFVVEPGASTFELSFGSSIEELGTTRIVEAGHRYLLYELNKFVAKIGDVKFFTLKSAVDAAVEMKSGTIELLPGYNQYPQAWVTDCVIAEPDNVTGGQRSYYTFHAYNPENGDEELSQKSQRTEQEQERMNQISSEVNDYKSWPSDFEVYFDNDVNCDNFSLIGNYAGFGWLEFQGPSGTILEKDNKIPLLHYQLGDLADNFTYEYMLESVYQFHCGILSKNDDKMFDKTFSVELCMYHPVYPNVKILIGRTDYEFKPVAKIGSKEYGTLEAAVRAAEEMASNAIIELLPAFKHYPQSWTGHTHEMMLSSSGCCR